MVALLCPHCGKVITDKDLANYPAKLEEGRLRNQYFSSDIYRKHNLIFVMLLSLGIIVTLSPVILVGSGKFSEYSATLLGLETVAGLLTVLWIAYSSRQNIRLQNKYIKSRFSNK